ncbi:MAG: imidazole glycerol phosphate synthase subunit HisH [Opitutae bacterium]|nr:imidazole glycerol phosphate synthase subunit HisH [Opitutae bacterium]|tara:strand:+ start:105 stop:734 length:630 start_codon:yes stop_codon:yes gene_type:complete
MTISSPTVAVIDYGTGNLRSVIKAFETLGSMPFLVSGPDEIGRAEALVFPGQGCFPDCMQSLRESGLADLLRDWIADNKPYFGICLGLQVLFDHSEEGDSPGLGVFSGITKRFRLPSKFKIPHMGWNEISFTPENTSCLKKNLSDGDQFYFVHSYCVVPKDDKIVLSRTDFGGEFVSSISFGNCHATQFHPEKSQAKGLQIYRNFLKTI